MRPERLSPLLRTIVAGANADDAPLSLGPRLGEGGMGVVHVATQRALRREVAVKMLRDAGAGALADRLLREAWITGGLEHPNVVPVHDLGRDERGRPVLVLKRIEGRAWSDVMCEREQESIDPLERDLGIFAQVCNAIAFAHSRGIVHRDLKPDNVMIGAFGEVYVLDWGIAVATRPDPGGNLPLASEAKGIAGTLAYMAPEMLAADGSIDERTDVYLLGAILFEIMTGSPPHLAESIPEALGKIAVSDPVFPSDVPPELAAIARRAMARDPADRFEGVTQLRDAVLGFVRHRGSTELSREAWTRLGALEVELAGAVEADPERRVTLYGLLAQCRFGFQQALRAWPDNVEAREGLRRAVTAMAEFELDQGDTRAARLLVAEMDDPPIALLARLEEAERSRDAERERVQELERLRRDRDDSIAARTRNAFGLAFAAVFVVGFFLAAWGAAPIELTHGPALAGTILTIAAIVVFAIRTRTTVMQTAINRGIVLSFVVGLAVHALFDAAAWATGLDMIDTHRVSLAMWSGGVCIAAVYIDRVLLLPALGFIAAFVLTVRFPEGALWSITSGLALFALTLVYIARRRGFRPLADLGSGMP